MRATAVVRAARSTAGRVGDPGISGGNVESELKLCTRRTDHDLPDLDRTDQWARM